MESGALLDLLQRELQRAARQRTRPILVLNQHIIQTLVRQRICAGRKFISGGGNVVPDIEIVGVAKDSKYSGVKQKTPEVYYLPWRQTKDIGALSFYVRSALDPAQTIPQIRSVMAALDRDLPLEGVRTLDDQVRRNIRSDRLTLQLAAAFAILATLMAMLGLYGVMAYSVTRRTREIGIRLALGAGNGRIRRMVMRELLIILAVGVAVGVPAALAVAQLTESQLFGVNSRDAGVTVSAVAALAIAAVVAGYFPARRATRVNPVEALRHD